MEAKKNVKYRLENKRSLFFSIGLVISMFLVISAFEWNYQIVVKEVESDKVVAQIEQIIPPTEIPEPEPPKPKVYVKEFIEAKEVKELEIEDFEIVIDQEELDTYEPPEDLEIDLGNEDEEKAEEVFLFVEKMPEPKGGYAEFYSYLSENLEYPQQARRLGVEGKVFVKFIVDENGNLVSPEVVKGIGAGCDEEAVRVILNAPAWEPGNQRGKSVKVQIIIPVHFVLHRKSVS